MGTVVGRPRTGKYIRADSPLTWGVRVARLSTNKSRLAMIGLIFLGLLACVHGLGDTAPYLNRGLADWSNAAAFAAGEWANAASQCMIGTRQSPIDILTTAPITSPDIGAIMTTGFDVDRPLDWHMNGQGAVTALANAAAVPTTRILPVDHNGAPLAFATNQAAAATSPVAIEMDTIGANQRFISGGPLDQSYKFSHVEFHWATATGGLGSEHSVDGTRAAMEMHVVHYKTQRPATKETFEVQALDTAGLPYNAAVLAATLAPVDPAGIAVIAYQIDVGAANTELMPLTDRLQVAVTAGSVIAGYGIATDTAGGGRQWTTAGGGAAPTAANFAASSINMSALMMLNNGALNDYYYYDGSLTAPADVPTGQTAATGPPIRETTAAYNIRASCAEIVRWIIPTQRLTLSAAQVAAFGGIFSIGANTRTYPTNSRPIQTGARITGITVRHRVPPPAAKDNAIWRNLAGSLLSVGTFGLVHNLLTQDDTAKALTENPVVDILQDIEQRFVRPAPQERQSFNHHHHPQDVQY